MLNLNGLPNPAAVQLPAGTKCDWQSFRMGGGNPPVPGRPGNAVTYAGGKGSWQAFPYGPNNAQWSVTFVSCKSCHTNLSLSLQAPTLTCLPRAVSTSTS